MKYLCYLNQSFPNCTTDRTRVLELIRKRQNRLLRLNWFNAWRRVGRRRVSVWASVLLWATVRLWWDKHGWVVGQWQFISDLDWSADPYWPLCHISKQMSSNVSGEDRKERFSIFLSFLKPITAALHSEVTLRNTCCSHHSHCGVSTAKPEQTIQ